MVKASYIQIRFFNVVFLFILDKLNTEIKYMTFTKLRCAQYLIFPIYLHQNEIVLIENLMCVFIEWYYVFIVAKIIILTEHFIQTLF